MTQVTPPASSPRGPASATTRRAYAFVREHVAAGTFGPGTWLREGSLADELGVSRTPVREALRVLATEGVVEHVHNRGARVVRWTAEDVEETYRLRALLEGEAAALAARRATPAQLDALQRALERHERAVASRRGAVEQAAANDAFHGAVLEAAGSPRLVDLHAVVASGPLVARALATYAEVDRRRSVLAHRDVLEAVRQGDERFAAAAMSAHILAARHVAVQAATPAGS